MYTILDFEIGAARHQEFLRQAQEANAHRLPAEESALRRLLTRLHRSTGSKSGSTTDTTDNRRTAHGQQPIRQS